MVTLGLSLVGHDRAVCLLDESGTPRGALEEERVSRVKGGLYVSDPASIVAMIRALGVGPEQVSTLALAGDPAAVDRRVASALPTGAASRLDEALLASLLPHLPGVERVARFGHHACHAASAWVASGFDQATVVTVDGKGDDESAALMVAGPGLQPVDRVPLPHSLGYLYTNVALWAGLRGHECEGKLMGLAAHGRPRRVDALRDALFAPSPGWGFRLSPLLASIPSTRAAWAAALGRVLGPSPDRAEDAADVAASLQHIVAEILVELVETGRRRAGVARVCVAGGVFLNSVANGALREELGDALYVPPWPGDQGLAIGAAMLAAGARPDRAAWPPFLGPDLDGSEVEAALGESEPLDLDRVAALLAAGAVVGWARGRMEFGPRALGNRSILASPSVAGMRDRLNRCIKNREAWRPFAPVVPAEHADDWFEGARGARFMSFVCRAHAHTRDEAGQALHVDGTARVQALDAADNPSLHALLLRVGARTGTPILINTSFNVRGEPIVRTAAQAVATFREAGMDALVLGDRMVTREQARAGSIASRRPFRPSPKADALLGERRVAQVVTSGESTALRRFLAERGARRPDATGELCVVDAIVPAALAALLLPATLAPFVRIAADTIVFGTDRVGLTLDELLAGRALAAEGALDYAWRSSSGSRFQEGP